MPEGRLSAALRAVCENRIDCIVVGGLAAVLNGAPLQTYDIDLVYSLAPENIDRLLSFLREAGAVFRIQPERRLEPTRSHLAAGGHLNLITRYGPMDLLGTIGHNLSFEDLLPHSIEMELGEAIRIHVLSLETLISVKEQLSSEKDTAALPILRQTLRERDKKKNS